MGGATKEVRDTRTTTRKRRQPSARPVCPLQVAEDLLPDNHPIVLTDTVDWTEMEVRAAKIRKKKLKSAAGRPPHLRVTLGALTLMALRTGWTAGGAPFGLTYDEWRSAQRTREGRPGWARTRSILEEAARLSGGRDADVGRLVKIGGGMSHEVFGAALTLRVDPENITGPYVVLLPRRNGAPDRATRARNELRFSPGFRREASRSESRGRSSSCQTFMASLSHVPSSAGCRSTFGPAANPRCARGR
jgi:hypothetical protein